MESALAGDIIFFAVLAGFILFKLHSTLGRKPDDEEISRINKILEKGNKKAAEKKEEKADEAPIILPTSNDEPEIEDEKLVKKLNHIKAVDKNFSAGSFLAGAKVAFEMVIKAFSEGDEDTLKQLLSSDVYKEFKKALEKEKTAKTREETTLVSIISNNVTSAEVVKNKARINIEFVSEQISVTKDKEGNIISGTSSDINKIEDRWVFERDLKSSDPNWKIVST